MIVEVIAKEGVPVPTYATEGSAGVDLAVQMPEPVTLHSGCTVKLGTGIRFHMGNAEVAMLLLPRSGWGHKGLVLANTVGVVDSDYQGEVILALRNSSPAGIEAIVINPGDRVAQALFIPVIRPQLQTVSKFTKSTVRGEGGFGSTGD